MLGAKELRFGVSKLPTWAGSRVAGPNLVTMVPMERFLDFLAVRVNRPKAGALSLKIDWPMNGENRCYRLTLSNGAAAQATILIARAVLAKVIEGGAKFAAAIDAGDIAIEADRALVLNLMATLDNFNTSY
jgi:alkyl sulfatase BDS1-like metallo-beta-lactamase superfamily hydrolase